MRTPASRFHAIEVHEKRPGVGRSSASYGARKRSDRVVSSAPHNSADFDTRSRLLIVFSGVTVLVRKCDRGYSVTELAVSVTTVVPVASVITRGHLYLHRAWVALAEYVSLGGEGSFAAPPKPNHVVGVSRCRT